MFIARSFNALFAVAAIVFAIGCGSSDAESGSSPDVRPPSVAELVERVPGPSVQTLDLAAARRPPEKGMGEELWMIQSTMFRSDPTGEQYDQLKRSLNPQDVTAIVRSDGPPSVLLLAVELPWDEAREEFERDGWQASAGDGLLEMETAGPDGGTWYLTGRDGLVVLSTDADTAADARDGEGTGPAELVELISGAGGVAAAASTDTTSACVRGFGIGYSPSRGAGEISLLIGGDADPSRAKPNGTGTRTGLGYKYGKPTASADGQRVVVPYTKERARNAAQLPMGDIVGGTSHFEYEC